MTCEASLDVFLSGANQSGAIGVRWPFCKVTNCIGWQKQSNAAVLLQFKDHRLCLCLSDSTAAADGFLIAQCVPQCLGTISGRDANHLSETSGKTSCSGPNRTVSHYCCLLLFKGRFGDVALDNLHLAYLATLLNVVISRTKHQKSYLKFSWALRGSGLFFSWIKQSDYSNILELQGHFSNNAVVLKDT